MFITKTNGEDRMIYDLIIIGAGPAGLAAGVYAGRRHLKTLVISENIGGNMSLAHLVENYPGIAAISGIDLAEVMKKQAESFHCEFVTETVDGVSLKGDVKEVAAEKKKFQGKSIIIATGAQHRKLNIQGEDKFLGKGVSYCATCDGPLFKGKKVVVVGGSDCACVVAAYLAKIASEVYLIHRRDKLRADEHNQEKIKKLGVKIIWDSVVEKIEGDNLVNNIKVKNVKTEEIIDMPIEGVFIEIGYVPTTEILEKEGIETDEKKYIKANEKGETNIEGVFAAGDVTGGFAQIVTAVSKGAVAATNAYFYLQKKEGESKRKDVVDWGHK
jgi:thioredoxin reductase (NADPH)